MGAGLDKHFFSVQLFIFFCPSFLTCVLGAQKNHLIEMVLLSTHNICLVEKEKDFLLRNFYKRPDRYGMIFTKIYYQNVLHVFITFLPASVC